MIKIAITGSIASGKTSASKILSKNRGQLFSADTAVKKLYKNIKIRKIISKKCGFKLDSKFKVRLSSKILSNQKSLIQLEKIIHPLVRKEMLAFLKKNKRKKILFFEIPLLIEKKLMKYFDKIIFIKSNKKLRLHRYTRRGGNKELFKFLDSNQIKDTIKINFCDYVVVNNKTFSILKKNLLNIIKNYE